MSTTTPCVGCHLKRSDNLVALGVATGRWDYLVALAGNPNTGKSTVFNALTGLRQHTGNWPGKTVVRAEGSFDNQGKRVKVVDLPGTYSLDAGSADEEVARDFLLFGQPDVTVVVVDATRLERNLNLVVQVLEVTDRVVVCLNLMDEARRHGLTIDVDKLSTELGVPVIPTVARRGRGIPRLLEAIHATATGTLTTTPIRVDYSTPEVERAVSELASDIETVFPTLSRPRWVALRLLGGDKRVEHSLRAGDLGRIESGFLIPETADELPDRPSGDVGELLDTAAHLRWRLPSGFRDAIVSNIYKEAQRIAERCVSRGGKPKFDLDDMLDRLLTSRWLGFPTMLFVLAVVFWITIAGANVPSGMLSTLLLDTVHPALKSVAASIGVPWWLDGVLLDGVYLATAWVVAVMLPPMAIFFPLFTLLEDFGYLPRVAFNLDALFRKVGAHGKQALTMCMGFGCNAAGVVATRVIDSPRERLIAIITNNFSLCNGRWPTQILIATIFVGALVPARWSGVIAAGAVVSIAVLGMIAMFGASWLLSQTVLRGQATTFSLELPPYRPPRILQTLYTSLIDRTLIVLWRAVVFAAPAGLAIWLISNINISGVSLASHFVSFLDPFGILIGLNGVILLAYVVAIPANEIVIPTVLMLTALTVGVASPEGTGVMFELESGMETRAVLVAGGWTLLTGINLMLFSLLHNPCSTTLYTIYKETRSMKWTAVSAVLPLVMGFSTCFVLTQVWLLFS